MSGRASVVVVLGALVACAGAGTERASPAPAPAPAPETSGRHGGGHHPDFPACAWLAKACHPHDKESEKAHACHVLGHRAPSNEACEAERAACLVPCGGADGGT